MNKRSPVMDAIERGKADIWCKTYGGFAVAQLSTGEVDYFPVGQSPNVNGERDRGARILARFSWNHERWSRTQ